MNTGDSHVTRSERRVTIMLPHTRDALNTRRFGT
jgi:hypothetical protein